MEPVWPQEGGRLGAQGPRSLGPGEMGVREEKGADHEMGREGKQRGHLCPGTKGEEKREREGDEGGGEPWVLEGEGRVGRGRLGPGGRTRSRAGGLRCTGRGRGRFRKPFLASPSQEFSRNQSRERESGFPA